MNEGVEISKDTFIFVISVYDEDLAEDFGLEPINVNKLIPPVNLAELVLILRCFNKYDLKLSHIVRYDQRIIENKSEIDIADEIKLNKHLAYKIYVMAINPELSDK